MCYLLRLDADLIVDGPADPLLTAEITFSCLHRYMSEQELSLVEFASRRLAQLRTSAAKILGSAST